MWLIDYWFQMTLYGEVHTTHNYQNQIDMEVKYAEIPTSALGFNFI